MNAGAGQSEVKVIPMVKPVQPSVREDEFLAA